MFSAKGSVSERICAKKKVNFFSWVKVDVNFIFWRVHVLHLPASLLLVDLVDLLAYSMTVDLFSGNEGRQCNFLKVQWMKSEDFEKLVFFINHITEKCAMSEINVYVGVCH